MMDSPTEFIYEASEEDYVKEGPIRSIFFAEFHTTAGPKIVYQYPENVISKEVFDAVSVYIIPKPQIMKRVVTVNVLGHKITGYPNEIKNLRYARNALMFNLCFVCDSAARTVQYEPCVKKLSEYLEHLETENGFLSNEESSRQIPMMLCQIMKDLNASGRCTISIFLSQQKAKLSEESRKIERRMSWDRKPSSDLDGKGGAEANLERKLSLCDRRLAEAAVRKAELGVEGEPESDRTGKSESVLHLKVVGALPDPGMILDHHVPVMSTEQFSHGVDQWDLTTQQILPYIDGYSHVAKIAALADVESNLVKACIQNLLYYNVVKILPIFQYSNVYTVTSNISKLYTDVVMQNNCIKAVSKSNVNFPSITNVLMLYCSMTYGVSLRNLCVRLNPQTLHIDERKLVQFGLLNHLIRRLHQYPVIVPTEDLGVHQNIELHRLCNGTHSFDELCCKFGLTHKELEERIDRDPYLAVLWK